MATAAVQSQQQTESATFTYDEMTRKRELSKFLNIDPDGPWTITTETDTGLALINHTANADMNLYSNLRGVVLDTQKGNLVSYSFPHADRFVGSQLPVVDGKIILSPNVSLNVSDVKIKRGFEGTLVYVFKHAGKVYRSTRKKMDFSRSKWGKSKTFGDIYWELGGPKDEDLFDPQKDYSVYCHTFILSHPDLLVSTREMNTGYLVYLGPRKMYTAEENGSCPYPLEKVDTVLRCPVTTNSLENAQGKIFSPSTFTLEEANAHLLFGNFQPFENYQFLDPRLLPGEFVILEDTSTCNMYRVESPSYYWRNTLRDNNPNLLYRFYQLLDFASVRQNDEGKYRELFPLLSLYDLHTVKSWFVDDTPVVLWPQSETYDVPRDRDSKMYHIFLCFLMCVPLSKQKEVSNYYELMLNKREELISWIQELSAKYLSGDLDIKSLSTRLQDIIVKTRSFAEDKVRNGQNFDNKTKKAKDVDTLTNENIRNFIRKEMGTSLYRLTREMETAKEQNTKEQQAQ